MTIQHFQHDSRSGEGAGGETVAAAASYEPPKLRPIGTVAELTCGVVPVTTDGIGPGSAL